MKKSKSNFIFQRIKFLSYLLINFRVKELMRYLLWIVKYQSTLPSNLINNIIIFENNEPLIELKNSNRLIINAPIPKVRESVYIMIKEVIKYLPKNLTLCVVFAYRDLETQEKFWGEAIQKTRELFPNISEDQIILKAKKLSALPTGDGPHQTGGAIDVILLDQFGNELPMGTTYREPKDIHKVSMFSKYCTKEEKNNRKILRKAMLKSGFYYYPGEWWHYSYGDRMWAAYTGNTFAIYGSIKIPQ